MVYPGRNGGEMSRGVKDDDANMRVVHVAVVTLPSKGVKVKG